MPRPDNSLLFDVIAGAIQNCYRNDTFVASRANDHLQLPTVLITAHGISLNYGAMLLCYLFNKTIFSIVCVECR